MRSRRMGKNRLRLMSVIELSLKTKVIIQVEGTKMRINTSPMMIYFESFFIPT